MAAPTAIGSLTYSIAPGSENSAYTHEKRRYFVSYTKMPSLRFPVDSFLNAMDRNGITRAIELQHRPRM